MSEDVLLDAARAAVLAVGVRRTTMSDVARRAGVSRMTAYRRYPDVTTLLQALVVDELGAVIDRARAEAAQLATARERVVHASVRCAGLLAAHPLLQRALAVDPDLLLPYLTTRTGPVQRQLTGWLAAELADGDGSVRDGDPDVLAAAIELAVRGFVASAGGEERDVTRGRMLGELRVLLDGYLRPLPA